jgi:hypothetical protein
VMSHDNMRDIACTHHHVASRCNMQYPMGPGPLSWQPGKHHSLASQARASRPGSTRALARTCRHACRQMCMPYDIAQCVLDVDFSDVSDEAHFCCQTELWCLLISGLHGLGRCSRGERCAAPIAGSCLGLIIKPSLCGTTAGMHHHQTAFIKYLRVQPIIKYLRAACSTCWYVLTAKALRAFCALADFADSGCCLSRT